MTILSERFPAPGSLLDSVATYYPDAYNAHKLDQLVFVGSGADAYVYNNRGTVYKFTQNEEHARVANYLASRNEAFDHIVRVYEVYQLKHVGLWLIQEECLVKAPVPVRQSLYNYFNADSPFPEGQMDENAESYVDNQIQGIIVDLSKIAVKRWNLDCLTPHNLLLDPKTNNLKVFDFGYTTSTFLPDYKEFT
jgi:serine/threonine protein kinase